jgi:hypothetical protein
MVNSIKVNGVEYQLGEWQTDENGIDECRRFVLGALHNGGALIYESIDNRLIISFVGVLTPLIDVYRQMHGNSIIDVKGVGVGRSVYREPELVKARQLVDHFLRKAHLMAFA